MKIIDNYRKLPIGKYNEIVKLCETEMDEVDRKVKIVGILTGLTDDEVLALLAFFFGSWTRSINSTLSSSERMARRVKDKGKRQMMMERIAELRSTISGGGSPR